MKNLHLMMLAAAGLLTPTVAQAEINRVTQAKMFPSPTNDVAPVSGTPARLRRTNEEQPGNENAVFALAPDAKSGVFFSQLTELNGQQATHRMQLAAVPFVLKQDATGAVVAEPNLAAAKFITSNRGNEYRNANKPEAITALGATCAFYNYQAEGSNDTKRYVQCLDPSTLAVLTPQKQVMGKNHDECARKENGIQIISETATKARLAAYFGCNGNGRDDGWVGVISLTKGADGKITARKEFDLSVEPQEERSRGTCSVGAADPNTMFCTWTAGNNQPQRNGTWIGAIDVTEGKYSGANQQEALLWKAQLGGRRQIEGRTTYSMRATHQRILAPDTTGKLIATDMIAYRQGDLRGNNNTNGKGGSYYANRVAVIKLSRQGMEYVTPMKDVAPLLLGLDGTHLNMEFAMFGKVGELKPGFVFHSGSHTGGGYASQTRVVMWDQTASAFVDGGSYGAAPHDRHLYPNYLGNNPGNQGRNHSAAKLVANPYVGLNGNTDAYLMVISSSGKDPSEMTLPQKKLSSYLTVMPVAQAADPMPQPPPQPQPSGQSDSQQTPPGEEEQQEQEQTGSETSDATLGGCSTSGGSAGFLSLLLVGIAAFIRRRR
jgi:MYXO-CTERM domain-containing protein